MGEKPTYEELERRVKELESEAAKHDRVEASLKNSEALMLRNRIADILLTTEGSRMFRDVLSIVLDILESPLGYFGYIDDHGDLICPSMQGDVWDRCAVAEKNILFPKTKWGGLWGRSLLEKRSHISNAPLNPPEGHLPIRRALVCPIVHGGELIGQIAAANKEADYTEADLAGIEDIVAYIAPLLHERLEKDKTKEFVAGK